MIYSSLSVHDHHLLGLSYLNGFFFKSEKKKQLLNEQAGTCFQDEISVLLNTVMTFPGNSNLVQLTGWKSLKVNFKIRKLIFVLCRKWKHRELPENKKLFYLISLILIHFQYYFWHKVIQRKFHNISRINFFQSFLNCVILFSLIYWYSCINKIHSKLIQVVCHKFPYRCW